MQELGKIMIGEDLGSTSENMITSFGGSGTGPSSGLGIQFAAVGNLVYKRAGQENIGQELPINWFLEDVHP